MSEYSPPMKPCRWLAVAPSLKEAGRARHHVTPKLKTAINALKNAEVAFGVEKFWIRVIPLEDE